MDIQAEIHAIPLISHAEPFGPDAINRSTAQILEGADILS